MEEKDIILKILERFIIKIKSSDILYKIFRYYVSDFSQMNERNKVKISLDYDSINLQVKRGILTQKNNYWNIKLSELKVLEEYLTKHQDLSDFETQIKSYLNSDLSVQLEKVSMEEKQKENSENEFIKDVLKDSYSSELFEAVKKILSDKRTYPYKSDVIKAFLSISLNVEQIFILMSKDEKLVVQRGYIEKYKQERIDGIASGAIKVYSRENNIREILKS